MHLVVVGGGIFGLTAANELVERGHTVSIIGGVLNALVSLFLLLLCVCPVCLFSFASTHSESDKGFIPDSLASSTDISKLIRSDYGSDALYSAMMQVCALSPNAAVSRKRRD